MVVAPPQPTTSGPCRPEDFLPQLRCDGLCVHAAANSAVHDTGLVHTELHLTSLRVLHSRSHVGSNRAHLGVWHQATWAKDLTQGTHNAHGVRSSDHHVEGHVTSLHHGSQVIHANDVSASSLGFFRLGTLREDGHTGRLASTVGQHYSATHHLVGLLGITAQLNSHVDGFIEL